MQDVRLQGIAEKRRDCVEELNEWKVVSTRVGDTLMGVRGILASVVAV